MVPAVPLRRRRFLATLGGMLAAALAPRILAARGTGHPHHHADGRCPGRGAPGPHPEPRKDHVAAVLTAEELDGDEDLIALFDSVRKIPQVVDGIRCHCGCADSEGMYSLLSCYEGDNPMKAMSKWCPICQGQGRLTVRLAKAGKTLEQIREAIDVRY